jgi:4-amino-4-deoxy-L-arabinose transferase-like glycosyltransferase
VTITDAPTHSPTPPTQPPTRVPDHASTRDPLRDAPGPSDGTGGEGSTPGNEPGRFSPRRVSRSGWITAAIAALTTVLYSWNLTINGYGNDYYAAAVKSASVDWKAFFFGSIDPGNFITVDKPPAALWLQALSVRIFGFSSASMLLPEVVLGVASVLILHRLVRKWQGDTAAHLAALALALTPVAVLMFRFNNPDALLTFLGLAAAWGVWAALESGRTRGLIVAAALTGLAFETKMMQAFLVVPAFILVYLVAGKPKLGRRILQLGAALVTMVVAAGWWIAIVALVPAADRPYVGSTTDNSIISLLFGYNGLARIFGNTGGGGGGAPGGGGGSGFGGAVSWLRMLNSENGGQIAWLLPLALAGLLAGLWLTRRAPRTDLQRAGWLLWGAWAAVCFITFSRAQGVFHSYYTVQLAPAVAALAGAGGLALWQLGRRHRWMQWALPVTILVTAGLAIALLQQTPTFVPWLRPAIVVGATLAVIGLVLGSHLRHRPMVMVAAAIAAITLLAGPTAYAVSTVQTAHTGSIVLAGPAATTGPGMGMGGGRASTADAGLIQYLEANRGDATYLVAAFGSQSSSAIIIATGEPVMTIGGFNGGDPAPTLAQFQQLVASGQVRFVLISGNGAGGGPGGGNGTGQAISSWVTTNGTQVAASAYGGATGGATLYDLAGAA